MGGSRRRGSKGGLIQKTRESEVEVRGLKFIEISVKTLSYRIETLDILDWSVSHLI